MCTKVNVWCALRKDRISGPFFFEGRVVNSDSLDMLQSYFIPELTRLGPTDDNTVFRQDGALVTLLSVRQFLNENFPNRWIGRGGPTLGHHVHQI